MPRRQRYALLIALAAGTATLATAVAFGTTLITDERQTPPSGSPSRTAAHNPAAPANSLGTWVATWTGAPVSAEPAAGQGYPGRTIRNVVHTSVGGDAARITLSNLFGTAPLVIDQAAVNTRPVTFQGRPTVTVAAGGRSSATPSSSPSPPTPTSRSPSAPRTPPDPSPSTPTPTRRPSWPTTTAPGAPPGGAT